MMPALKLVAPDAVREAPYDSEVGAKGWRFEIDYERVEQSDTWALADPEMRPWLLMLWLTSWKQRPCGSLPNDDALIAARIGMKVNAFRANREVLMRGWWLANDGKLYHDTIVERAQLMHSSLRKESARKAAYRESLRNQSITCNVPRDNHGTDTNVPRTSTGRDATGTGTGTGTGVKTLEAIASLSPAVSGRPANGRHSPPTARKRHSPPCPHVEIVDLWNRLLPDAREVAQWTAGRATHLRARWNDDPKRQTIAWWEKFFTWLAKSPFLMGKRPQQGRKLFRVSLDWLVKEENFAKVYEGQYHEEDA